MLTFCVNNPSAAGGYENGYQTRLLFICKAQGKQAAIPRVMHKHDERFELLFIMQGRGTYHIDGQDYQVKSGDVLLFNSGVLHDEHPHPSDDLLIFSCGVDQLKFDGVPLNHLIPRSGVPLMPSGEYYDEIRQIFYQMWDHVSYKKAYSSELGNSLLRVLLLLCRSLWQENHQERNKSPEEVGQRIRNFIDEHYKDERVFNSITSELNMNKFYLAHIFKAFSGYSPKQYQTRRRIGEAQSLLLSTDWGVTKIANAVGYDNVNNFHRIFNNIVGLPPARYKKFWLTGQIKS